jgi:cytoskeletal protein CcmA (bactofilin family)
MFSKNREKLESFIGVNSLFKGDIRTKGTLRVDGKVHGNVEADWCILSDKAHIKGDITANGIIVGGHIEGNLTARETVEVRQKGKVMGDISSGKLMVAEGGYVDGRVTMYQSSGAKLVEFSQDKTKEAKETKEASPQG